MVLVVAAGCAPRDEVVVTEDGCPSGGGMASISWIDMVKFEGTTYSTDSVYGRRISQEGVGEQFARTRCKLADEVTDPGYESHDGDATFLEPGTPVHEVNGYDPTFRLAARRDGKWTIYEAREVDGATMGRDLLDIEGKVTHISVNSPKDGTTEIGAVRDEEAVAELVEMVLDAPVDEGLEPDGEEYDDQVIFAFHLEDGTVTSRALYPKSRLVSSGIVVPQAFVEAIEKAGRKSR